MLYEVITVAVDIQGQRLVASRDVVHGLIDVLVRHDRNDRCEYLLLHDQHVGSDVGQQCRMYRSVGFLERAADRHVGAFGEGIVEELLDPGEIPVVDDLGDVRITSYNVCYTKLLRRAGIYF